MKVHQPKNANYYDLVKIPHGHIPAPMIKFWDWLPIPEGPQRTYNTFHCPTCGSPTFFKTGLSCHYCEWDNEEDEQTWKRYIKRERRRKKWKRLEHAILPLLILTGQARYMVSERLTDQEQVKKYGPSVFQPPWPDDWETEMKQKPLEKKCDLCRCELTEYDDFIQQDYPQCCEEHGDFLDLCESCLNWFEYNFEGSGCIRATFYGTRTQKVRY